MQEPGGPPDLAVVLPDLPYLVSGTHKLTQSKAILRYIARKHNMYVSGAGVGGRDKVAMPWAWLGGDTEG